MKIVVLGAGNVGSHFMEFCERECLKVTLIDKSAQALELFKNKQLITTIQEDFNHSELFNQSFFKNTELFFAVTASDETNLIACKTVSEYKVPHIVCRNQHLKLEEAQESLETELGKYFIVNPSELLAREITRHIETPNSIEQFWFFDNSLSMIGFNILDFCKICNQSINSISKKLRENSIVPVGIQREGQFCRVKTTDILQKGDVVYFFCSKRNLRQLRKILGYYRDEKSNIVIAGGGEDGYNLAKILNDSSFNFHVKIVEPDIERCRWLAEKFDDIMVLNLSSLDKQGLLDENIEHADIFVAVNKDVASNVSSCFLVYDQPLKQLICLVEEPSYQAILNFFSEKDIRSVCSHVLTARFLGHFIYSKKILKYYNIQNTSMEMLELVIDYPGLQGYPFKEVIGSLNLDEDSIVLEAVYRNKKIIFNTSAYKFHLRDKIIVSVNKKDRNKVLQKIKPNL